MKMDLNYYIEQAQLLGHDKFDLSFADVIEVFDNYSTELITEDFDQVIITWDAKGNFKRGFTYLKEAPDQVQAYYATIESIITKLKEMNVDVVRGRSRKNLVIFQYI